MMSKLLRIISTGMILVGIAYVFVYTWGQGSRLELLNQPSYYTVQNYWFIFVSGIGVIVFSLLGSFFSWFKQLDVKEEILPNAGYASGQEIQTWIKGSTADQVSKTEIMPKASEKTEIFGEEADDHDK